MSPLTSSLWVEWYSCHGTTLFQPWYRLTWIRWLPSVYITQYFYWVNSHIILGFLNPFYSFGHPRPVSFLSASLAHLIFFYFLHSHGLLIIFLGSLGPIATSFTFRFVGLRTSIIYQFLSLSSFSLFLLSFYFLQFLWVYYFILWGFLELFAFSKAILLFCRPVDHYSCHFGLLVFTLLFYFSTFFILSGFFYHWALLPKMSINNYLGIYFII